MTFLKFILRLLRRNRSLTHFKPLVFISFKLVFELCYSEIVSLEYELSNRFKLEVDTCLELNISMPKYP